MIGWETRQMTDGNERNGREGGYHHRNCTTAPRITQTLSTPRIRHQSCITLFAIQFSEGTSNQSQAFGAQGRNVGMEGREALLVAKP